jgi:predicted dehydrogenase
MSRIGVAVVGLGPAAEPHAKSLVDLADRVDVRWAVTRSQARAEQAAARYPFQVTTDLDRALADPLVQAVLVLTPPGAHLDVAERCFKAGKHVLVEKPLELSAERARRLVAAGRASGLRLGVVLQHRFRPGAVRLRGLLAEGALGEVAAGWVTVPWWRPQGYYDEPGRGTWARDGGGVLLTQAIHALDLFRSLVGVSEVVSAIATTTGLHRMETEDYVTAQLRLGNGAPGMLAATTAFVPGRPERIEVFGTRGSAVLAGGSLQVDYVDGGEERLDAGERTGSGANIMDFPNDAHRSVLADFLDAVQDGRDPAVTGEEALATQTLIETVLQRSGFSADVTRR